MVSDAEPRYRLVDSNGNIVGSLYAQADGTLALQEGTSGSDNEVTVDPADGTFRAPAVSAETVVNDYHYAGAFDGAGEDARLDAALTKADNDDKINLENGDYSDDRTINTAYNIVGTSMNATTINADWAVSTTQPELSDARFDGSLTISGSGGIYTKLLSVSGAPISVSGDQNILIGLRNFPVTFESGAEANVVDSSTDVTVTDNGNNTVGDVT